MDKYYSQADVMLFASLNEVTPMVLAEAMIRQIPVITTDIAGIPEMLTHKTHGFVLRPKPAFIGALHALGGADADCSAAASRWASPRGSTPRRPSRTS